jgi:hypothetical protein
MSLTAPIHGILVPLDVGTTYLNICQKIYSHVYSKTSPMWPSGEVYQADPAPGNLATSLAYAGLEQAR